MLVPKFVKVRHLLIFQDVNTPGKEVPSNLKIKVEIAPDEPLDVPTKVLRKTGLNVACKEALTYSLLLRAPETPNIFPPQLLDRLRSNRESVVLKKGAQSEPKKGRLEEALL